MFNKGFQNVASFFRAQARLHSKRALSLQKFHPNLAKIERAIKRYDADIAQSIAREGAQEWHDNSGARVLTGGDVLRRVR